MQIRYGGYGVKCDFHTFEWEISTSIFTVLSLSSDSISLKIGSLVSTKSSLYVLDQFLRHNVMYMHYMKTKIQFNREGCHQIYTVNLKYYTAYVRKWMEIATDYIWHGS